MEDTLINAKKKAMTLLLDMDRTEKDLRDKLKRAGFSEENSELAVAYVKSYGYINDERYAKHFIEVNRGRKSERRMKFDLANKGIAGDIIEQAFLEAGDFDEMPEIRRLLEKKARTLKPEDPRRKEKLSAFLSRRGYKTGDIIRAIEENERLT